MPHHRLIHDCRKSAWVTRVLPGLALDGQSLEPCSKVYFLSRDIIVPYVGVCMPRWRDQLFPVTSRNATSAVGYFNIQANSVIEQGSRVQL